MTVKQFFKSTAFKSLAVLLSIVIIAGALLAVFHDLLAVTDAEKENRVYSKIYGEQVETELVEFTDEQSKFQNGSVEKAVKVKKDGNYLVKVTGNGAFGNGTVTVWVVVEMKAGALAGIGKVVFESTTVSKYYETSSDFFKTFDKNDDKVAAGEYFGVSSGIVNPSSGATASARAINNAVNTAIDFIKAVVLGQSVGGDSYEYEQYIDVKRSVITPLRNDNAVKYELVVNSNEYAGEFEIDITVTAGKITAYEIKKNGSTENPYNPEANFKDNMPASFLAAGEENFFYGKGIDDVKKLLNDDGTLSNAEGKLHTGASLSTQSCIWAAAFATANFNDILYKIEHEDWITDVTATVDDGAVVYTLKTVGNSYAEAFVIDITVKDNVITAYEIKTNGSTENPYNPGANFKDNMPASFLAAGDNNYFVGKNLEAVEKQLGTDGSLSNVDGKLHTGASLSTQSCIWAAIYALANYNGYLAKGGTQK